MSRRQNREVPLWVYAVAILAIAVACALLLISGCFADKNLVIVPDWVGPAVVLAVVAIILVMYAFL